MCRMFRNDLSFFLFANFLRQEKQKKSLEITREFHPDDAGFDEHIVKRAARWC
jgi:hypothetical protein